MNLDPEEARAILERHFTAVTMEEFVATMREIMPELFDDRDASEQPPEQAQARTYPAA
ncbi:MAG: hypothetical protein HY319_01035 [Armatimonadetes bacterium]|nr:hypothetical protein [Armatimonadota bacterium]